MRAVTGKVCGVAARPQAVQWPRACAERHVRATRGCLLSTAADAGLAGRVPVPHSHPDGWTRILHVPVAAPRPACNDAARAAVAWRQTYLSLQRGCDRRSNSCTHGQWRRGTSTQRPWHHSHTISMQAHRQLQWVLLAAACAQLVLLLVPSAMSALHSSAHATAPPGPAAAARASSWVDAAQQGVALLGVVCAALLLTLWARLAAQHAQPPRQHSSECAAAAAAAAIKPSRAQAPAPASGGTPDCTLAAAGCLRARLPPPAPAPPCVDVWVLAGQSNCVGTNQADGHDMPPRAAPAPGRILSYNRAGVWWCGVVGCAHAAALSCVRCAWQARTDARRPTTSTDARAAPHRRVLAACAAKHTPGCVWLRGRLQLRARHGLCTQAAGNGRGAHGARCC